MTTKSLPTPTIAQFRAMQDAYDYFNQVLFGGQLPGVILNLSRKSKACGFVAPFRWRKANEQRGSKGSVHELSINPEILAMSAVDVYSTLVHEQCHIWQHEFGTPSRGGYHNQEWADKMLSIGLIPSTTGKPGGKMTGQHMSDYPEEGGKFLDMLDAMPESYKLPFVSIEGDYLQIIANGSQAEDGEEPSAGVKASIKRPKNPKNKVKYTCPGCHTNVWGKPELKILCGECEAPFQAIH